MSIFEVGTNVRPFHVEVPEAELAELRRPIEATRWPSEELVADRAGRAARHAAAATAAADALGQRRRPGPPAHGPQIRYKNV